MISSIKKKNLLSLIKISRFFNSKKFQFLSCMTPSSMCQCRLLICQCRLNDRLSYYACMIKATLFFTVNEIYNKLFFTDITKERKIMYWNKDKWKKKKKTKIKNWSSKYSKEPPNTLMWHNLYMKFDGNFSRDYSDSRFGTIAEESSICETRTAPISLSGSSSAVFACKTEHDLYT